MKFINVLTLFVVFFSSCNKDCDLPKQIIGTGEIIEDALVSQPIINSNMSKNEHVIRKDSLNIFNLQVSFDDGSTYQTIDFSKYTLLGKYAKGKCHATFERIVSRNDLQKKAYYDIKIHQCGSCKTNWESMNWVLIPKLPADYEVVFDVVGE